MVTRLHQGALSALLGSAINEDFFSFVSNGWPTSPFLPVITSTVAPHERQRQPVGLSRRSFPVGVALLRLKYSTNKR
jgi:hypothetical protein